uniref:Uncharacterized protein n=1 Tax=Solanum lycopersicum TaxID=4081 RepID=K4BAH4_SOLLC
MRLKSALSHVALDLCLQFLSFSGKNLKNRDQVIEGMDLVVMNQGVDGRIFGIW